jgi:hypothetical protein
MRIGPLLLQAHEMSAISSVKYHPSIETAIDNYKTLTQLQFLPPPLTLPGIELKQVQVSTARHNLVYYLAVGEDLPLLHQRPDAFGERHDSVGASQRTLFGDFGNAIRQRIPAPVICIHVLVGHQPADVKIIFVQALL